MKQLTESFKPYVFLESYFIQINWFLTFLIKYYRFSNPLQKSNKVSEMRPNKLIKKSLKNDSCDQNQILFIWIFEI